MSQVDPTVALVDNSLTELSTNENICYLDMKNKIAYLECQVR